MRRLSAVNYVLTHKLCFKHEHTICVINIVTLVNICKTSTTKSMRLQIH